MPFPAEATLRTAKPPRRELRGGRMLRTCRSVHVNEHILPDLGPPRPPYPTPLPPNQPNSSPTSPLPTDCPGSAQAQSIPAGEMEAGGKSASDPAPPEESCPGAICDGGDRAMLGLWEGCAHRELIPAALLKTAQPRILPPPLPGGPLSD